MIISSGSGNELIQIADAVAKEKLIDPKLVIEAMEESLAKAAKSKYGQEYDIRAEINSKSGTVSMSRWRKVVQNVENHFTEINEPDAKKINHFKFLAKEISNVWVVIKQSETTETAMCRLLFI